MASYESAHAPRAACARAAPVPVRVKHAECRVWQCVHVCVCVCSLLLGYILSTPSS